MKNIIFTGGGTAGHIMPNIALFPFLKDDFALHYVGEPDSMEQELLKKYPFVTFHAIKSVKFIRSLTPKNLLIPFKVQKSKAVAKALLKKLKPKVIFSKGGFAALPVTLAAKNIPLILHESDFSLGLANKLVAKKCKVLCTSFDSFKKYENAVTCGSPLRAELYSGQKDSVVAQYRFTNTKKQNLLIFGGSLGAKAINDCVEKSIKPLTKKFNVIHITGKNSNMTLNYTDYYRCEFVHNIADYFAWADFCVSRGGANALFELVALNIPSLIIPLPKGNSRGDQVDNAKYFESQNFIKVLYQEDLSKDSLLTNLDDLITNKSILTQNMKNAKNIDGTKKIIQIIKSAAKLEL